MHYASGRDALDARELRNEHAYTPSPSLASERRKDLIQKFAAFGQPAGAR